MTNDIIKEVLCKDSKVKKKLRITIKSATKLDSYQLSKQLEKFILHDCAYVYIVILHKSLLSVYIETIVTQNQTW